MPILNRANSSPNLKDNWHSKSDSRSHRSLLLDDNELDFDDDFYVIGDRVYVDGHRPGSVAYFGETEFGSGDWVGVVLDDPTGNHNGKLHGREYFQCAPFHGLFVRTHRVSRISDSALGSSATSSRCATPLPTFQRQRHDYIKRYLDDGTKYGGYDNLAHLEVERPRDYKMMSTRNSSPMDSRGSQRQTRPSSRMSNGSSLLDTYYYDEDYRQDRVPTVASLARKLKSMGDREEERQQQQREHREQELQRPLSRATSLSSSASPIGILKRHSSHHSSSGGSSSNNNNSSRLQFADDNNDERVPLSPPANFGSRVDDLNRRLRANSASPSSSPRYVFNFRPKREQLSTNNARPPAEANDNYGKNKRSVYLSAVDPPQKGDRVLIRTEREGELSGVLRFMGETNFATGEWAGIELDDPVGKNDGSILGCRYFYCPKNYGLFVPATRVRKRPDSRHEMLTPEPQLSSLSSQARHSQYSSSNPSIFGSMRSTIKSPPPLTGLSRYSSGSRSTTPSYDMGTLSPTSTSTSSPSSKQHSNTDASRQQTANYYPEYSGSSYPTSMTPSSLEESRKSNDGDCSGRISPVAPKRDSSLNDRYSLFGDTPTKSRTYDNNFKSSASSTSLFNSTDSARRPKFDDRDIELQLNKSLSTRPRATTTSSSIDLSTPKPKAVKYTFISNKLNGNPIARRTLIYK